MDLSADPNPRREPTDPGYASLAVFKSDLRAALAAASPSGTKPSISTMRHATGLSKSTLSRALDPTHSSRPTPETIHYIVGTFDPTGRDYWLTRLDVVQADPKVTTTTETPTAPEHGDDDAQLRGKETLGPQLAADVVDARITGRRWKVWAGTTVAVIAVAAITTGVMLARDDDSTADDDIQTQTSADPAGSIPSDHNDPARAGCLSDANRLQTERIEPIGMVSLVHSPKCDAYWGRAERLDGQALGNHIDIKLTAGGSDRTSTANDPDANVVYTYLLTRGTATEFCVDATFWMGTESFKFRQVCSPARAS